MFGTNKMHEAKVMQIDNNDCQERLTSWVQHECHWRPPSLASTPHALAPIMQLQLQLALNPEVRFQNSFVRVR
jgi:hypothetical protein